MWWIILIVLLILVGIMIALYFVGNKMQKKQMAQKEQINAAAQPVNMFIIDKKVMPMKDAKLPKAVMDQAPKRYQKAKLPIVKAKVGPQVLTLICDESIFADVPNHGEVKAMVSGIYLTSVRTIHKGTKKKMIEEELKENNGKKRKKSMREKMLARQANYQRQMEYSQALKQSKKDEKAKRAAEKKSEERAKKIKDSF